MSKAIPRPGPVPIRRPTLPARPLPDRHEWLKHPFSQGRAVKWATGIMHHTIIRRTEKTLP